MSFRRRSPLGASGPGRTVTYPAQGVWSHGALTLILLLILMLLLIVLRIVLLVSIVLDTFHHSGSPRPSGLWSHVLQVNSPPFTMLVKTARLKSSIPIAM